MPIYDLSGKIIAFRHIPKTGGTSISAALAARGESFLCEEQRYGNYLWRPRHVHNLAFSLAFPERLIDFDFAVVRHPLDRLFSEYRYQRRKAGLHFSRTVSFGTWVRFNLLRTKHNRHYRDSHFLPQVYFIGAKTEIFKFENGFVDLRQKLSDVLGASLDFPEINQSPIADLRVSNDVIELIEARYGEDYQKFGYPLATTDHNILNGFV